MSMSDEELTNVARQAAIAHVVPNERGMVTCNGIIYTEGEPGKCWVGEDHSCITNPTIIAMLEDARNSAQSLAPSQGDEQ